MLSFIGATSLLSLLLTLIAPLLYIILLIMAAVPHVFIGRMILKAFSQKNSIFMEFITGLITATLFKFASYLSYPSRVLAGIRERMVNFVIFSFGMGILMEHHYLNNNRSNARKES